MNKSCFAWRLEDRRGSAQALGLSLSQLALANLYTKVLAAVWQIGRRCREVIFTSQASRPNRRPVPNSDGGAKRLT